mmetsp:Transcript_974/g.1583  ORF Transcript_974/g.1583 Transcript_974/m.1583 type:complete len:86 (-) Transcript_974:16-273(-)
MIMIVYLQELYLQCAHECFVRCFPEGEFRVHQTYSSLNQCSDVCQNVKMATQQKVYVHPDDNDITDTCLHLSPRLTFSKNVMKNR